MHKVMWCVWNFSNDFVIFLLSNLQCYLAMLNWSKRLHCCWQSVLTQVLLRYIIHVHVCIWGTLGGYTCMRDLDHQFGVSSYHIPYLPPVTVECLLCLPQWVLQLWIQHQLPWVCGESYTSAVSFNLCNYNIMYFVNRKSYLLLCVKQSTHAKTLRYLIP